VAAGLAGLLMTVACSKSNEPMKLGTPAAGASEAAAPAAPASTAPEGAAAAATVQTVTGTVTETMDASSYTYVKVKSESGEIWAASGKFTVKVGDKVVVPLETPMQNFRSETLKRDFPLIYFTSRISKEGEAGMVAPNVAVAHAQAGPGSQGAMPGAQVTEKIAPAAGGMSVADVWAKRASLAGKSVTVRGKVVKFNGGIMGRNWIHIQDGTGVAKDGTHDLTVTTNGEAQVGAVITVTGKLAVDKDFGAGYAYKAIVEDATIAK
jgi:hypothetical protein